MGAFQNIGIKDYFKRYGVLNSIKRGLFTVNPLHIVTDYENKKYYIIEKYADGLKINILMRQLLNQ